MPQMAPLNWLGLYIFFILILWTFIINIFFLKIQKFENKKFLTFFKKNNWKW